MDASTAHDIIRMKMNKKEREHKGRNRLGFHVYLSRFYFEFYKLPIEQQQKEIFSSLGIDFHSLHGYNNNGYNEDSSIDSTDSIFTTPVNHRIVHKAACRVWKMLPVELKTAWNKRAKKLNKRKLPGKFLVVPFENGLKEQVLNSLSYEWNDLVGVFRRCLTRNPKIILSTLRYRFGDETVTIGSQSYRDFRVSYLVELVIFGRYFKSLHNSEIIKRTKKQIIVHISSKKRMDELFSKEGLNATEFLMEASDNQQYDQTCSGKVSIMVGGKLILGYILTESNNKWKILLRNNKMINIKALHYNTERKEYVLPTTGKYIITAYWPIRFLIRLNGKGIRMTLNRLAYQKKTKGEYKIMEPHSS